MAPIIERENAEFQELLALKTNRLKRTRERAFFVEGVRSLNLARETGWEFAALYARAPALLSEWARTFLTTGRGALIRHLSEELMAKVSDKEDPSELVAVVRQRADSLERIPLTEQSIVLVLDRPASPGNLGSILRSADAFGVSGIIVTGHAVDLYDPQTIRASTGSCFAVPAIRLPGPEGVLAWVEASRARFPGLGLIGTDEGGGASLWNWALPAPAVIVLGNEQSGLSRTWREACAELVSIPMVGRASSLNVSCAASIVLAEAYRQRQGLLRRGSAPPR